MFSRPALDTAGFDARWNGPLIGNEGFLKSGAGTLTLTAPGSFAEPVGNAFGAQVSVSGGALALAEAAVLKATVWSLIGDGKLVSDRTADGAVAHFSEGAQIALGTGELALVGRAGAIVSERVGSLQLYYGPGMSTVTLTPGAGGGAVLHSSSVILGGGTLAVRAENLGGGPGGTFSRLTTDQPGIVTSGFVPGIYTQTSADPPLVFTTYDPSKDAAGPIGLRSAPTASASVVQNPANGGTTPEASAGFIATGTATAIGTHNVLTGLSLASGASLALTADQTLGLEKGAVLTQLGASAATITGGTLDLGARVGFFATLSDLAISSTLTGSAGLRKFGPGKLTLSGSLDYTGLTTVTVGTLRAGSGGTFGSHTIQVGPGATLDLDFTGSPAVLGGVTGEGTVKTGTSPLTLGGAGEDMNFAGRLESSGALTIVGGGNPRALRELGALPGFTGSVTLESGHLRVPSTGTLGTGVLQIRGGALRGTTVAPLATPIALEADLVIADEPLTTSAAMPLTLAPTASIGGPHSVVVQNRGGLTIQSTATHTGETRSEFVVGSPGRGIISGITLAGGQGVLTATSAIRIAPSSMLLLEDIASDATANGRIPDGTPIFLDGSLLQISTGGILRSETVGSLHGAGFNTVSLGNARLTAASLVREDHGTFLFRSATLGASPASSAVLFSAGLAAQLVGGGGTGPETSILPFATGGPSGNGSGLVTYDAANGIRLLNDATEYVTLLSDATPASNLRLASSGGSIIPVESVNAPQTINALVLGRVLVNGTETLTISSGTVLATGSSASVSAPLAFGAAEGNFFVPASSASSTGNTSVLTLSGTVNGSGGVTKSGLGDLVLTAANAFTGPLTINSGNVRFSSLAALGPDTSPVRIHGDVSGTGLFFEGAGTLLFTRDVEVLGGLGALRAGVGAQLEMRGRIRGAGGLLIGGAAKLTGANTYTGPTVVQGALTITSDAALGQGGLLQLNGTGATLALDGNWTTDRQVFISNESRFDLRGRRAELNGALEGNGALTVAGSGTLRLAKAAGFMGGLSVETGTLVLAGAIGNTLTIAAGATLAGNAEVQREVRLSGTLSPGENGPGAMKIGSLTLGADSWLTLELASAGVYDRVEAGLVTFTGPVGLALSVGFDPLDGFEAFTVLSNNGLAPLYLPANAGIVFGNNLLEEGERFVASGQEFEISYSGGDGNDIVLRAVPEPSSGAFLLAGSVLACHRRKRRTMASAAQVRRA